jgi:SAM-dependent methyltransferase
MLDMVYGHESPEIASDEIGRGIFGYTAGSGRSPQAVRNRRTVIATLVDEISQREENPRILSIACGHLREVEFSAAFKAGAVQEWIGVDQDEESLRECARAYGGSVVRPIKGSVRQLLSGKLALGEFDLVYAAGLFDYLSAPLAGALISRMFRMLKPNGKMMVANFRAGFVDAGYMEAFMDWKLIYRSKQDLRSIFEVLDGTQKDFQMFTDPWKAVVYATVNK